MKRSSWVLVFLIVIGVIAGVLLFQKKEEPSITPVVPSDSESASTAVSKSESSPASKPESSEVVAAPSMLPRKERMPKSSSTAPVQNLKDARLESHSIFADTRWKFWPEVTAHNKKAGRPQGRIVGEVSGYYLLEEPVKIDVRNFSEMQPLVVVDPRLEIVGVVTGVLSVVLKPGVSEDLLKGMAGLTIRDSFPEIRTYFVTASEQPFDLQSLWEILRRDPSVEQVNLEILSRHYEKY